MISLDTVSPLTFNEFRNYYNNYNNFNELQDLYNTYLADYKENKDTKTVSDGKYIPNNYKELLKNIDHSDLNEEVKDYLKQLNYDNPYELDIAAHYVSDNRSFCSTCPCHQRLHALPFCHSHHRCN